MTSKLEYLKCYSKKRNSTTVKKGIQKRRSKSNFRVIDDDVTLKSTDFEAEEVPDPDDAPLIAELKDESVVKWQPLAILDESTMKGSEVSCPPRPSSGQFNDLSPPRRSQIKTVSSATIDRKKILEKQHHHKTDIVDSASEKVTETVYRSRNKNNDYIANEYVQQKNDEFMQWGRGVAQGRMASDQARDEKHEMSKPLARFADDEDLERMLKSCPRDGDPMLQFIKKKKKAGTVSLEKGKPQFKGNAIPNRFGIRPGYRWDGVDRSNGFEKAWISKASTKKVIREESYKWSVEDM